MGEDFSNDTWNGHPLIDLTFKWEEVKPFVLASIFLAVSVFMKFIFKYWRWTVAHFPEAALLIIVGIIFGGICEVSKGLLNENLALYQFSTCCSDGRR